MKARNRPTVCCLACYFPIEIFLLRETSVIRLTFLFAIMATTVSMTAETSDAQLFRRSCNSACVQQRMCRPRCCRPARQPICCQRAMPNCCAPVASSCCGCNSGCGCHSGCNSGCGCDGGSIVVNPANPGEHKIPNPQDCQGNYDRCVATCNGCTGAQKDECMAYCVCVLNRCNNPGLPPCTVPACGGPNATGN